MAEVVQDTQQDFWRSPTVLEPAVEATLPPATQDVASQDLAEACIDCGTEFMIGARFCHTCGRRRPAVSEASTDATVMAGPWARSIAWSAAWVRTCSAAVAAAWRKISLPDWLHYLHFHEIKRWVGVSLFYRASNLAEFQAIQMWRIEWLLAATASFVAGILLKKPSGNGNDSE
jgi:hypothetical protein